MAAAALGGRAQVSVRPPGSHRSHPTGTLKPRMRGACSRSAAQAPVDHIGGGIQVIVTVLGVGQEEDGA